MRSINKDSSGFSPVEAILVLVIVGLIGYVGWYVAHAKHAADKTLNTAASTTAGASTKPALATGTDNSSLDSNLNAIGSSLNTSSSDSAASNSAVNDQSSEITVPTN